MISDFFSHPATRLLDDMDVPLPSVSGRAAVAVVLTGLVAVTVGGWMSTRTTDPKRTAQVTDTRSVSTTTSTGSTALSTASSNRFVLRFEGHTATGTLNDSAAARRFAALLPLTLHLSDPMGQAKSGPLPGSRSLDVTGADRTSRTRVGELAFWSPASTVAIVYDDLGQRVPPPGLVPLGVIVTGLTELADAGNSVTVRVDPVSRTRLPTHHSTSPLPTT